MAGPVEMWVNRIDALAIRTVTERGFNVSTETPSLFQDARSDSIALDRDARVVFLEGIGVGLRTLATNASGQRAEVLRSFATIFSTAAKGRAPRGH